MEIETLFLAALQSSFLLGLIHGVNPCGHSWLVLAPFVTGEQRGRRVALLTAAFVGGTAVACLVLGATLGTVSSFLPPTASWWVDMITSLVLLILGAALLYNPEILHSHGHQDHDHDHHHHDHHHQEHDHGDHRDMHCVPKPDRQKKWLAPSLFGIGFINMVIPCPTAAIMYGYAINSGSVVDATLVFCSYAVSTALAVGAVIFVIFKATAMAGRLQKDWVEPLIMRIAGVIIIVFSGYGLYSSISSSFS
ncbi:MAG: sulfite exporter TauE/SafE family protein [Desulforhopalus sp.]